MLTRRPGTTMTFTMVLPAVCEAAARQAGFQRLELAATLPGEPLYAALGYAAGERLTPTLPDGQTLPIVHMHKPL